MSKPIKEAEGAITCDKYQTGDFVSMDQNAVKNGGRLPTCYGWEHESNEFHGGTLFVMLLPNTFMFKTRYPWAQEKQSLPSESLRSGFGKKLGPR